MLIGNLIPWRNKARESEPGLSSNDNMLQRFHSEVDRLFDRFFNEPLRESRWLPEWWGQAAWSPSVDLGETEDTITVRAELPGVDPQHIDVTLSGDVLLISGEKKEEREERREGYFHSERHFGSFRRSIPLPASVNPEKITADYDKGVLTVRLKKTEKSIGKRIPVSTSK